MRHTFVLAILLTAVSANGQSTKSQPKLGNERFANPIAGIEPIMWKDFEPIQKNVYACLDDKKLDTPVCKRVQERMNTALLNALDQAHVLNVVSRANEPKFCDKYGEQLIKEQKSREGLIYALMIVSNRMKYGSSLYGADLPTTYLGKIVHDALLESEPCKR